MSQRIKTGITLSVLLVLLLVGAAVGWAKLTEPVPDREQQAVEGPCEDVPVGKGVDVRVGMVTVSVYNAGTRSGLATNTLRRLTNRGFGKGNSGNADREISIKRAQVWTTDKRDPAALLVRRHLGLQRTPLVVKPEGQLQGVGVMVVVGNNFDKLAQGKRKVTSQIATTVCSPIPEPAPE